MSELFAANFVQNYRQINFKLKNGMLGYYRDSLPTAIVKKSNQFLWNLFHRSPAAESFSGFSGKAASGDTPAFTQSCFEFTEE